MLRRGVLLLLAVVTLGLALAMLRRGTGPAPAVPAAPPAAPANPSREAAAGRPTVLGYLAMSTGLSLLIAVSILVLLASAGPSIPVFHWLVATAVIAGLVNLLVLVRTR